MNMPGRRAKQMLDNALDVKVFIGIDQKKCRKCNEIKNRTEFPKSKQSKDGLYTYCKECNNKKHRKWYSNNVEYVKQRDKIYRIENNEIIIQRQRNHYYKNRENILADKKVYREDNKDEINLKRREALRNNPEKRTINNLKTKIWHEENKEQVELKRKEHYEKNKDEINQRRREKNSSLDRDRRDILNEKARICYAKNKDDRNEKLRKRREGNITKKISNNIGTGLRHSLPGNKAGRRWETLVGYTVHDVKVHMENLFTEGMTWDDFLSGKIHIDHKIPIIAFRFNSAEDEEFKNAWSLRNLQPLWATDNLRKNDKIIYPDLYKELTGRDV